MLYNNVQYIFEYAKNIPVCLQNIHASIKLHFSSEISSEKLKKFHVQEW